MKTKFFTLFTAMFIALSFVALPVAASSPPHAKAPMWWFEYEDMSIRWRADKTKGKFLVDLDGDHSTAALSDWGLWHHEYGTCSDLGVVKIFYDGGLPYLWRYGWAFRIGELKIDQKDAHIHETYLPDYTEWFYFKISKPNAPTNWMVILLGSDGNNPIPVTSTFWYSEDNGYTWNSFTP